MTNLFVESGRMQFMPNFPPYALPIVKDKGGKVASVGEIAHAFTYSPHVESIVAVDIADALRPFGYQSADSVFVVDGSLSEDGKLVGLVQRESADGRARIIAREVFPIPTSHTNIS